MLLILIQAISQKGASTEGQLSYCAARMMLLDGLQVRCCWAPSRFHSNSVGHNNRSFTIAARFSRLSEFSVMTDALVGWCWFCTAAVRLQLLLNTSTGVLYIHTYILYVLYVCTVQHIQYSTRTVCTVCTLYAASRSGSTRSIFGIGIRITAAEHRMASIDSVQPHTRSFEVEEHEQSSCV